MNLYQLYSLKKKFEIEKKMLKNDPEPEEQYVYHNVLFYLFVWYFLRFFESTRVYLSHCGTTTCQQRVANFVRYSRHVGPLTDFFHANTSTFSFMWSHPKKPVSMSCSVIRTRDVRIKSSIDLTTASNGDSVLSNLQIHVQ